MPSWPVIKTWEMLERVGAAAMNAHIRNLFQILLGTYQEKGDILVATGGSSLDRLPVGGDGQVPVADSAAATGLRYATLANEFTGAADGSALVYDSTETEQRARWQNLDERYAKVQIGQGCEVRRTTNQAIQNNIDTAVIFNSEVYDDAGFWTSGDPTKLVIPEDGRYMIGVRGTLSNASITGGRDFRIVKNGADNIATDADSAPGSGFARTPIAHGVFTAGDYVEWRITQSGGMNLDLLATVRMWIVRTY